MLPLISPLPLASPRPVTQAIPLPGSPQGTAPSGTSAAPRAAETLDPARAAFDQFVGQTFYGQLLGALRQTQQTPAYFHGGRGEEAFRSQLDQVLAEKLSESSAGSFTGPMYELFQLSRR